jgi:hypothetical protein
MLVLPPQDSDVSILTIEGGLTAIAVGLSFCWPRLGFSFFSRIERALARLARRRRLAVAVVGLAALLLRLAILPFCPIPLPFSPGDFSFLLAADTFAHGRLTNPTPAMWVHFESIHITMQPTYMSMYFPSQGLVMAASQVLLGQPWWGLLIVSALMCAAICWMLQGWLPPNWALLGGFLAVMRLGLFSYWTNTYHSGGSIAALGGALVLGALPRLMKAMALRHRDALLMAAGVAVVATTRPYEGLLLCLPVVLVLGHWLLFGKNRPAPKVLIRHAALPVALLIAAGAWMAYYDYRAFGSPTTLPYTLDRATYAVAPYYVWQSQRPDPGYRHESLRRFYYDNELPGYKKIHTPSGFVTQSLVKALRGVLFFAGLLFLPLIFMLRRVFLDRRVRFLVVGMFVLAAGMLIQIFLIPHYLAPFTAGFYAIGLQAMRHLRVWSPGNQPVGMLMTRLTVTLCVALCGLRIFAVPLHFHFAQTPASNWTDRWYGPGHFGTERDQIETRLEPLPGKQLVLVRYTPGHDPEKEWVYNSSDIDGSKVIWAREMNISNNVAQNTGLDTDPNEELIRHYQDRQVWLVQPDAIPAKLSAYPMPAQLSAALR